MTSLAKLQNQNLVVNPYLQPKQRSPRYSVLVQNPIPHLFNYGLSLHRESFDQNLTLSPHTIRTFHYEKGAEEPIPNKSSSGSSTVLTRIKSLPIRFIDSETDLTTSKYGEEVIPIFRDTSSLLKESLCFLRSFPASPPLNLKSFKGEGSGEKAIEDLFREILRKYDGFCLGEAHGDVLPKYLLFHYMDLFASAGVDVIFYEGLLYEGHVLDGYEKYFQTGVLPAEIRDSIKSQNEYYGIDPYKDYSWLDVIKAAQKAGISIIPLESKGSYETVCPLGCKSELFTSPLSYEERAWNRCLAVNVQAKMIIERAKKKKCIIYTGWSHSSSIGTIPGIAQILKIPSVCAQDSSFLQSLLHRRQLTFRKNYTQATEFGSKTVFSHFDFHISAPRPRKSKKKG